MRVHSALVCLALLPLAACSKSEPPAAAPAPAPAAAPAAMDARGVVAPRRIVFDPADPNRLLVVERSGTVSVWNVADLERPTKTWTAEAGAIDAQFMPNGLIVAGGYDGRVRAFNAKAQSVWVDDDPSSSPVRTLAVSADRIAVGREDGVIRLLDFDGATVGKLSGTDGMVLTVAFSPRGDWLASEGADTRVRLWKRSADGKGFSAGPVIREIDKRYQLMLPNLVRLDVQWGWDRSVAFSPSGSLLAASSFDGSSRLWSLTGQPQSTPMRGHDGHHVRQIAFSPDGQQVITGGFNGGVQRWALDGSARGEPMTGHTDAVCSLAVDKQGRLATASIDGSVLFWDLQTGKKLGALPRGN